ncbi:hypothetical protein CKO15_09765 [Halorhodospira abdelmalekii]|uniref:hypothetical protein n=1 Tax=Halorhodospira abdelmalekii TaxID=421629 RepID=UPI001908B023|nr:hypothetical protein [Halorhodospira abdelmalekii]MBK1735564.1 hypothetical protein [Halorhodospira abdelmalekii]
MTAQIALDDTIVAELNALENPSLEQMLATLAAMDARFILERAQNLLDAPGMVIVQDDDPDPLHAVCMELWRSALLGYYDAWTDELEDRIEHDVPTWIDANAPVLLGIHLALLSSYAATRPEVEKSCAVPDNAQRAAYEAELAQILHAVWESLEALAEAHVSRLRHA